MRGPCTRGQMYIHKTLGRVCFISNHPDDGACLIVERYVNDKTELHYCEHSDLDPVPDGSLEPFKVSISSSLVKDDDGDFVLFCPRINDAALAGYSEAQILEALGAS